MESPIDAVDPFVFFAETLQGIQAAEPQRFVRVDGDGSPEATHGLVIAALSAQLGAA